MKVCNNGAIVGRIVRAENNTYVSQLFISVSTITVGTNISCLHKTESSMKLIGTSLLTLTTGNTSQKTENLLNHSVLYFADPYPPPATIYLMEANSSQLGAQLPHLVKLFITTLMLPTVVTALVSLMIPQSHAPVSL